MEEQNYVNSMLRYPGPAIQQPTYFPQPLHVYSAFDGSAIKEFTEVIRRAEQMRLPMPKLPTMELLADQKEGCLCLVTTVDERKKIQIFCTGFLLSIIKVKYPSEYSREVCYFLEFQIGTERRVDVVISQQDWGQNAMLIRLYEVGITFPLKMRRSETVDLLMRYFASFLDDSQCAIIDPYPGWRKEPAGLRYMCQERWVVKTLASEAQQKALGCEIEKAELYAALWEIWNHLRIVKRPGLRLLILSLITWGLYFKILKDEFGVTQEQVIIIRCVEARTKLWLKNVLNIFQEDRKRTVDVCMDTKKLQKILRSDRDQVTVIGGDGNGDSTKVKKNLNLIRDWVESGEEAGSVVAIIIKKILLGLLSDESIIFEFNKDDIDLGKMTKGFIDSNACSHFAAGMIKLMEGNYDWVIKKLEDKLTGECDGVISCLKANAFLVNEVFIHLKINSYNSSTLNELLEILETNSSLLGVNGLGKILVSEIMGQIGAGELVLHNLDNQWIEGLRDHVIFYDSRAVYLSQEVLKNRLLPVIATEGTPILNLITQLDSEGLLEKYPSSGGTEGYRKKIYVKKANGEHETPRMLALKKHMFEKEDLWHVFEQENLYG